MKNTVRSCWKNLNKSDLVELGPVNRFLPFLDKQLVALGEMFAAEKASMSREG